MGKIFCFIGKSSSGKDTIFNIVKNELTNLEVIVPYTTRPIRNGETNGIEYHFVDNETFHKMVDENLVIEYRSYETIHGIWTYFTSIYGIDIENKDYLLINTLEGYNSLKKQFGDKVIPIYIQVDDGLRLERALKRERSQDNPKYEEMCRRFLVDQKDFSEEKLNESNIVKRFINNVLTECILEIETEINTIIESDKQITRQKKK